MKSVKNKNTHIFDSQKKYFKSRSINHLQGPELLQNSYLPSQKALYNQLVRQIDIRSPVSRQKLEKSFKRQYRKHLSILESHQLKLLRFTESRQRCLKEIQKVQQKKSEQIVHKLQKASDLKKKSIVIRSKIIQRQRIKWQDIRKRNKIQEQNRLNYSKNFINKWEQKCTSSRSRKQLKLQEISQNMRGHINLVESVLVRSTQSRKKTSQSQARLSPFSSNNPQKHTSSRKYFKTNLRISTQQVNKKHKQITESQLQSHLFRTLQKQKRIDEARAIKQYLNSQRKKIIQQKEKIFANLHRKKISEIKLMHEQRNKILDNKFKEDRKSMLENSLPVLRQYKKQLSKTPSNHQQIQKEFESAYQPSYQRHIVEKLRDMTLIMKMRLKQK